MSKCSETYVIVFLVLKKNNGLDIETHRGYIIENWILWVSHGPEKMGVAK